MADKTMTKEQQLSLLKELLGCLEALEEFDPHFTNRRRIKEVEAQIKNFK